jgi:hypothetical protein
MRDRLWDAEEVDRDFAEIDRQHELAEHRGETHGSPPALKPEVAAILDSVMDDYTTFATARRYIDG